MYNLMEFFKLSSQKLLLSGLFFILSGCSLLNPYVDRQRNAGAQDLSRLYSGPSTPEAPVICFNGLWTDDEQLQEMADNECVKQATGDKAEFVKKTYLDGKLLLPNHAHYKCVKNKRNQK